MSHLGHALFSQDGAPQRAKRSPACHEPQHGVAASALHAHQLQHLFRLTAAPSRCQISRACMHRREGPHCIICHGAVVSHCRAVMQRTCSRRLDVHFS